jgi:hypothetical protein
VVRDADGAIVASAPKAEVGVSSTGLMTGRVRAQRLSLVGAEMQVRIEPDSKVTVFAGSTKRPFVTASASSTQIPVRGAMTQPFLSAERTASTPAPETLEPTPRNLIPDFAALLAWIDSLSANGLDGKDLTEIGLKNGNLTVDDQRSGKQWTFEDISLSMTRPKGGGIALTMSSDGERRWSLRATLTPGERGHRIVDIETQRIPAKDLMLAMRVGDGQYEADLPLSARIRANIGPDGIPTMVDGRVLVEKGEIIDIEDPLAKISIDRAEFSLDWDAMRHALVVPFQVVAGGTRMTLFAQLDAPREAGGSWGMKVTGGTVVLAASASDPNPLILNRFLLRMRLDPDKQRIDIEQGEFGNMDLGLLASGHIDLSNGEPRLDIGIAGSRMSVAAMKRLWPVFLNPKVRTWVDEHIVGGTVDRIVIATNAQLAMLRSSGPPIPDNGLAIEISGDRRRDPGGRRAAADPRCRHERAHHRPHRDREHRPRQCRARPQPQARNHQWRVRGARHQRACAAGAGALPSRRAGAGRGRAPGDRTAARVFRLADGAVDEPRHAQRPDIAGLPLRPDLPAGSAQYTINMDVANFAAEKLVMGQKVEATNLRVSANNQGYHIRGDVKINGVPAALDYRKPRGDADAEVRVRATLDESARTKFGFDLGPLIAGPVPVKIDGRVPAVEGESRFAIEADLTQARIDKLLPGWLKPAGRSGRATFTVVTKPQLTRIDDLVLESQGASVKGALELDENGEILTANFPVFQLSDGDKAMLRAERGPDGALRVMMRGEVYDGRGFVKQTIGGAPDKSKQKARDIDLDIRLGTVAGFHGEAARALDLRMSRRAARSRASRSPPSLDAIRRSPAICAAATAVATCSMSRPPMPARSSASPTPIRRFTAARCGWRWTRRPATSSRRRRASSTSATSRSAAKAPSSGSPPADRAERQGAVVGASSSRACASSSPARSAASSSARAS